MTTLERSIALLRENGSKELLARALALLGDIGRELGDEDAAGRAYCESLQLREDTGDRTGEGWMLERLASLQRTGDVAARHGLAERAVRIAAETNNHELEAACRRLFAGQTSA